MHLSVFHSGNSSLQSELFLPYDFPSKRTLDATTCYKSTPLMGVNFSYSRNR